jgi:hypothetical protein
MWILTIIKKFFKSLTLNRVLILVTIILTLLNIYFKTIGDRARADADRFKNNFSIATSQSKTYRDANGILVTQVSSLTLTADEIRSSSDSVIRKLVLELSANDEKLKQLKSASDITMNANYQIKANVENITMFTDSLRIKTITCERDSFQDSWIKYVRLKYSDSLNSNVKISTWDDLILYTSIKKQGDWHFKNIFIPRKKVAVSTAKSLNPYNTIRSLKTVSIIKH